jgi:hypothetical protein
MNEQGTTVSGPENKVSKKQMTVYLGLLSHHAYSEQVDSNPKYSAFAHRAALNKMIAKASVTYVNVKGVNGTVNLQTTKKQAKEIVRELNTDIAGTVYGDQPDTLYLDTDAGCY